jgi:hypothetical protein
MWDKYGPIAVKLLKIIACVAAATSNDVNKDLLATFTCFVNCENVGMAQYNLVHQFKEQDFPDVAFALDTTQAFFIGEFLYSNWAHPATSQFLLSTSKSQIQMIASKIT